MIDIIDIISTNFDSFQYADEDIVTLLWKHDFAKEYWGVEKAPTGEDAWSPACGVAASPLVVGKGVVVPVGGSWPVEIKERVYW